MVVLGVGDISPAKRPRTASRLTLGGQARPANGSCLIECSQLQNALTKPSVSTPVYHDGVLLRTSGRQRKVCCASLSPPPTPRAPHSYTLSGHPCSENVNFVPRAAAGLVFQSLPLQTSIRPMQAVSAPLQAVISVGATICDIPSADAPRLVTVSSLGLPEMLSHFQGGQAPGQNAKPFRANVPWGFEPT